MALLIYRGGFNFWPELLTFLTLTIQHDCFGQDEETNKENLRRVENSI
jgi:hypothetical protein